MTIFLPFPCVRRRSAQTLKHGCRSPKDAHLSCGPTAHEGMRPGANCFASRGLSCFLPNSKDDDNHHRMGVICQQNTPRKAISMMPGKNFVEFIT